MGREQDRRPRQGHPPEVGAGAHRASSHETHGHCYKPPWSLFPTSDAILYRRGPHGQLPIFLRFGHNSFMLPLVRNLLCPQSAWYSHRLIPEHCLDARCMPWS
jgi:hypothetical protein